MSRAIVGHPNLVSVDSVVQQLDAVLLQELCESRRGRTIMMSKAKPSPNAALGRGGGVGLAPKFSSG